MWCTAKGPGRGVIRRTRMGAEERAVWSRGASFQEQQHKQAHVLALPCAAALSPHCPQVFHKVGSAMGAHAALGTCGADLTSVPACVSTQTPVLATCAIRLPANKRARMLHAAGLATCYAPADVA